MQLATSKLIPTLQLHIIVDAPRFMFLDKKCLLMAFQCDTMEKQTSDYKKIRLSW